MTGTASSAWDALFEGMVSQFEEWPHDGRGF
jgi:hypothetical protein